MKSIIRAASIAALLAAVAVAVAAAPARADAEGERRAAAAQLYDESMAEQMAESLTAAFVPSLRAQIEQLAAAQGRSLRPGSGPALDAALRETVDEVLAVQRPILIDEMATGMTLAEIEKMREFYRTPEFASIMRKMPQMMQNAMRRTAPLMPDVQLRLMERIARDVLE